MSVYSEALWLVRVAVFNQAPSQYLAELHLAALACDPPHHSPSLAYRGNQLTLMDFGSSCFLALGSSWLEKSLHGTSTNSASEAHPLTGSIWSLAPWFGSSDPCRRCLCIAQLRSVPQPGCYLYFRLVLIASEKKTMPRRGGKTAA